MPVAIRAIQPAFAGEVSGIDITQPISPADVAAIEAGMDKFALLVFRGQKLTDAQQMAFSLNFGALENAKGGNVTKPADLRLPTGMNDVSNLGKDGKPLPRDSRQRLFNLGNSLWHSDSSFRATPAKYSLLSARVVNPKGGNTEFADMRAAYDALDAETKREVQDLICRHSQIFSRGILGFTDFTDAEREKWAPVRQRLVRRHPSSGRLSLYLASHAGEIEGWPVPEARAFIRDLTEHATQRQFVYAHEWQVNDLVMWDNRTVMHRARRFRDMEEKRDLRRTSLKGVGFEVAEQPLATA